MRRHLQRTAEELQEARRAASLSTAASSPFVRSAAQRSATGSDRVHCRYATSGSHCASAAPVSTARRVVHRQPLLPRDLRGLLARRQPVGAGRRTLEPGALRPGHLGRYPQDAHAGPVTAISWASKSLLSASGVRAWRQTGGREPAGRAELPWEVTALARHRRGLDRRASLRAICLTQGAPDR